MLTDDPGTKAHSCNLETTLPQRSINWCWLADHGREAGYQSPTADIVVNLLCQQSLDFDLNLPFIFLSFYPRTNILSPTASELDEKAIFLALSRSHILKLLHVWNFPCGCDKQPMCTEEKNSLAFRWCKNCLWLFPQHLCRSLTKASGCLQVKQSIRC